MPSDVLDRVAVHEIQAFVEPAPLGLAWITRDAPHNGLVSKSVLGSCDQISPRRHIQHHELARSSP